MSYSNCHRGQERKDTGMENYRRVTECFVGFYVGLVRNVDFLGFLLLLLFFTMKFVLRYLNRFTLVYLEIPVMCSSDPVSLRRILRMHPLRSQGISAS